MEMDQEMSQLPVTRPFIIRQPHPHPPIPPIPLSSHGTMFIRFRCHNLHKSGESTGSAVGNTLLPPQTIFPQEPRCYISYSVFKPKTLSFKRPSRIEDLLVVVVVVAVVVVVYHLQWRLADVCLWYVDLSRFMRDIRLYKITYFASTVKISLQFQTDNNIRCSV